MNKTDFIERVVQRLAEGKLRGMLGGLAQYHQQSTGQKPTISQLKGMGRGGMRAFSDIAYRAQGRQVLGEKPQARNLSPEAKKGMDITYPQQDAPAKGARLVKPTLPLRKRAELRGQQRPGAVVTKTDTGTVTEVPSRNPKRLPTLIAGGRRGSPTISKPGIKGRELTREDASHQFIDRTVGILVDRIEELRQSTMKSAASKAKAKAKALTTASKAAKKGGAGGAAATLATAAGGRTAQADRIRKGAKARSSGTPRTKPSERGGRQAIAASNQETRAARQELASHQNFIGNAVEILMERIKANKEAKNRWMASQPTDPDNEPKIPDRYKSEAGKDVEGAVQFNATSRSQYNVPKGARTNSGAGDSGKPFDAASTLTAARTVKKHTTNPLMSAVNARDARSNKAFDARLNRASQARRNDASHQNFIGKTVEILAEKLIGNQPEIDANGDKKITKKDFKILRKRKDEAINIDTSPEAQKRFKAKDAAIRGAFDKIVNKPKPENTPIDGRGVPKTAEQRAEQQRADAERLARFRADIAKKFGR